MEDEVEFRVTLENHSTRLTTIEGQITELNSLAASIQELTLSVNKLAINMEHMLREQKDQGNRIKSLESEPSDNWNAAKKTMISTMVSTCAGALAVGLLLMIAQYIS